MLPFAFAAAFAPAFAPAFEAAFSVAFSATRALIAVSAAVKADASEAQEQRLLLIRWDGNDLCTEDLPVSRFREDARTHG